MRSLGSSFSFLLILCSFWGSAFRFYLFSVHCVTLRVRFDPDGALRTFTLTRVEPADGLVGCLATKLLVLLQRQ